jgi:hypothetical protein
MKKKLFMATKKSGTAGAALMLFATIGGVGRTPPQAPASTTTTGNQATVESNFRCNINALTPAERAHHKQLTEKLIASRNAIVETEKGYEFQFSPEAISVADLADWVVTEEKCCPFFYFHIDLEKEGTLVCLGLTGQPGIKDVIRAEFQVPGK